jgi:hypothetical protein
MAAVARRGDGSTETKAFPDKKATSLQVHNAQGEFIFVTLHRGSWFLVHMCESPWCAVSGSFGGRPVTKNQARPTLSCVSRATQLLLFLLPPTHKPLLG